MERGMGSSVLKEVHMVGLTEKVIFEQRQERSGNSQVNRCEESIPGRGTWDRSLWGWRGVRRPVWPGGEGSRRRILHTFREVKLELCEAGRVRSGMETYSRWQRWMAETSVGPCRPLYGLWVLFSVTWDSFLEGFEQSCEMIFLMINVSKIECRGRRWKQSDPI